MTYDHSSDFENGDSMPSNPGGAAASNQKSGSKPKPDAKPSTGPAQSTGQLHRCSYCGQSFERAESKNMPFCSKRCQQIDLGMWLNESYGMPYEGESSLDSYQSNEESE